MIEQKRYDEARELAVQGLANTDPSYAGLVHRLQDSLSMIAAKCKDHSVAASVAAADRFSLIPKCHPSASY
ncbi:MAG: hypothetical protein R3B96_22015 [Pirellulaceae bacterium]